MGMGPMTGRAAGLCAGFATPGFMTPMPEAGFGAGFGRGRGGGGRGRGFGGGGRGFRHWYYATGLPGWMRWQAPAAVPPQPDPALEKQALAGQARAIETQLEWINKRLSELEKGTEPQGEVESGE